MSNDLDDWTEEEDVPLQYFDEAPLREQFAARGGPPEPDIPSYRRGCYRIRPADADQDLDPEDLW